MAILCSNVHIWGEYMLTPGSMCVGHLIFVCVVNKEQYRKEKYLDLLVIIFGVNMLTPGSVCVGYLLFVNAELFKFGQRAVSEYNLLKLYAS